MKMRQFFFYFLKNFYCSFQKNEIVLPFIIERKRMDDLASSIKDGRFREQKFRLKQTGFKNLIYLVERYGSQHMW